MILFTVLEEMMIGMLFIKIGILQKNAFKKLLINIKISKF
jgi:hypothetical protein